MDVETSIPVVGEHVVPFKKYAVQIKLEGICTCDNVTDCLINNMGDARKTEENV